MDDTIILKAIEIEEGSTAATVMENEKEQIMAAFSDYPPTYTAEDGTIYHLSITAEDELNKKGEVEVVHVTASYVAADYLSFDEKF